MLLLEIPPSHLGARPRPEMTDSFEGHHPARGEEKVISPLNQVIKLISMVAEPERYRYNPVL